MLKGGLVSNKQIKVLHFSTHNEECGIGKYQEMFLETMAEQENIDNAFFPVSPNQTKRMDKKALSKVLTFLEEQLGGYDILHIQHEFSFYSGDELKQIVEMAKRLHKKVVITVHTSPNVVDRQHKIGGVGPRSWVLYLKNIRRRRMFFRQFTSPLQKADIIILHNEITKQALVELGVNEHKMYKLVIPVPAVNLTKKTTEIQKALSIEEGDIVYCVVGFMHKYKGLFDAVKALSYLPENYKLAIVGGLHPYTDDVGIYNKVTDKINALGLINRVYITGFVQDDADMNALIRECDMCVYPYDREYYSNVSSAALNNSFANHMPVIAYPTESFKELNGLVPGSLVLTSTFSYYELARKIESLDLLTSRERSVEFAEMNSYYKMTRELEEIYKSL